MARHMHLDWKIAMPRTNPDTSVQLLDDWHKGWKAMPAPADLETKYSSSWRSKALRECAAFYVRAWQYTVLMRRMPDHDAVKRLQQ